MAALSIIPDAPILQGQSQLLDCPKLLMTDKTAPADTVSAASTTRLYWIGFLDSDSCLLEMFFVRRERYRTMLLRARGSNSDARAALEYQARWMS
ncbi:MAG: hypothetical protein C4296_08010 [Gemmataceae bacterium]